MNGNDHGEQLVNPTDQPEDEDELDPVALASQIPRSGFLIKPDPDVDDIRRH